MSIGRQKRGEVTLSGHDPLIVELVKLLARSAAERDYEAFSRSKSRPESKPETRRG
jgi:hypothetical protein